MFNRLFILIALSLLSISIKAQNYVDILKVDYSISKSNDFKDTQGTSDVKEWVVDATVPIVLSEKSTFLTGFVFENVSVSPYSGESEISVFTLNLKLGLNKTYSDKWSATYLLLPKFSSDMQNVAGEDFQLGIVSLFKFIKNENLNLKFGLYYNTDLFGPFLVPFAGFYYQKEKWEINALLPATVDVGYKLGNSLKTGLRFNGFIKSFNLNEEVDGMSQYLAKANNEVGIYLGYTFGKINVIVMGGRSIGRTYRTFENGDKMNFALSAIKIGDERTQLNSDFKDGLVLKTSLIYRFPIDNK